MEEKEVNYEWENRKSTALESAEEIIKTREKKRVVGWRM